MVLGTKLKRLREAEGMSLRDVAAATGGRLSPAGLSMIEQGRRYPTVSTLEALASALHVRFTITARGLRVEDAR